MKKFVKRALALVLFVTVIASSNIGTMAAPAENSTSETLQLEGIEKYFSKNVEEINEMVISQGATIADDYSVTLYTDTQSSNVKSARHYKSSM